MARKRNTTADVVFTAEELMPALMIEPTADEIVAAELAETSEAPVIETEPTIEEIEAAVLAIEATEDSVVDEASTEEFTVQPEEAPVNFTDVYKGVAEEVTDEAVHSLAANFDARVEFEDDKSRRTGKDNIFKTISKLRGKIVTKHAARVLVAAEVPVHFVNRELNDGSRYSVYAIGKIADILHGLDEDRRGAIENAINLHVMRSLFAFKRLGLEFTMEHAKASCSKQYRPDVANIHHLSRYTVSTSTAPTQASSTMQALQTLGVVRTVGSRKNAVYEVLDTPIARKLEEVLMAA